MDTFLDDAPTHLEPLKVDLIRDVVTYPKEEGQGKARHESECKEVVSVFAECREGGKSILADHRKQDMAAIKHVQPGDPQNDEGSGHEPVGKSVDGTKAQDRLA